MKRRVLIIGCGYVGSHLLPFLTRHHTVMALVRDPAQAAEIRAGGATPIAGDLDDVDSLKRLPPADTVFHLAPPPQHGRQDTRTRHLLACLAAGRPPRRLIYISTTGVYGDRSGAWTDECTACQPQTERARRRLDAETQLRAYGMRHGVKVMILRVPGIYGPQRLPLEKLRRGQAVVDYDPPHYSNRIHVTDLVQGLLAAVRRGRPNRVYNASDGRPSPQAAYLDAVAILAHLPPPLHTSPADATRHLSPLSLSFLDESRRLCNQRFIQELRLDLRHADFKDGIRASLAAMGKSL